MLAPQLLDEVVDGHDTSPAGEQEGEDRAFLRSGDRQRIPAVRHDLEGSEDEKTHLPDASAPDRGWLVLQRQSVISEPAVVVAAACDGLMGAAPV